MRIYPKDISVLEFDKIRTLISNYCHGSIARENAIHLKPVSEEGEITRMLDETADFKNMLNGGTVLHIQYGINVLRELNLLRIQGSVLTTEAFHQLRILAEHIETSIRFFKANPAVYPSLEQRIQHTHSEPAIIQAIELVLDTDKSVRSNASEELYRIRTQLLSRRNELQRVFSKAIQRLSKAGMLIDIEQSVRNGRKVVAIFAEHKRQIKGIVHGISDTGKSAYIEPEETVELNNIIVELEQKERQEIHRILRALTDTLRPYHALFIQYQEIIAAFDFIYAKAKLAIDLNAIKPRIHKYATICLKQAIHPLLYLHNKKQNKTTIPLSLELDHQKRILVISGPNAGGKTICLKLTGLLQMMLQSGLLVPVAPESEMGLFNTLMVSIGDTQSIEYELSTYSAHLKMMKHFVLHADKHTLFLIDEFGTGSDPTLGGAFAEAILEELSQLKSIGVVTTHYLNIKTLADRVDGIINGSMEFDEVHLKPLYKLNIGKPGSSYTFAIADRIGIPKAVVDRARTLVQSDQYRLEKLLRDLQREKQQLSQQLKQVKETEHELLKQKKQLSAQKDQQEHHIEQEVHKRTRNQLQQIKEAEKRLTQLISEWNKSKDKSKLSQKIAELTMKHQPERKRVTKKGNAVIIQHTDNELQIGDEVSVKTLNRTGRVVALQKKNVIVEINGLPIAYDRMNVVKIERRIVDDESPTRLPNRGEDDKVNN
ncbi:MAG: DNA mismatch repair protein MutS [Bacteroidetes bacterium]|nr:DNA mismatch repair protein MutS [Bacteroidota bacterium]